MTDNIPTSEVLNLAADEIQRRGWTTGAYGWPRGSVHSALCLEGGIMAALGVEVTSTGGEISKFHHCDAYKAVEEFLSTDTRWGVFRQRIYDWNDAEGRTSEEVVEVLRAAAAIEQARESQPAEAVTTP